MTRGVACSLSLYLSLPFRPLYYGEYIGEEAAAFFPIFNFDADRRRRP